MFFFSMCGEARQSGSKKGMEGSKEGGGGGGGGSCSTTPVPLLLPSFSAPSLSPLTLPSGRYLSVIPGMLEITIASPLIQGLSLSPLTGAALTPLCTSPPQRARLKWREQRERKGRGEGCRVGGKTCF